VRDGNTVAWRRAQILAASGYGNARSVARIQAVMAGGGAIGAVRLLSRGGSNLAWQEQFRGVDRVLGVSMRYGMGYGLFGTTYGWTGWDGSRVMIDPAARMAVAYVTNHMREPADDYRGLEVVMAAYYGLRGQHGLHDHTP
jgi:CubicO group peptidase (beta-lactamase class C family)